MPTPTTDAILQQRLPTPEARQQFDTDMRDLKVMRYQGQLGKTPEEQLANAQRYMQHSYPQLLGSPPDPNAPPHDFNTPERDAYIAQRKAQYPGPFLDNLPQFLADRGIVEQPKGFKEQVGYPLVSGGLEGGLATLGAGLGAASPLPGGAALGAGAGALASQALDPLIRLAMGMPQKSLGQMATDTGISVGSNVLLEGILSPVNKWLGYLNRDHLFYRGTPPPLTPGESAQIGMLGEGSKLAGTYGTRQEAFPSPTDLVHGSRGRRTPTLGTWMNDVSNVSLGGAQRAERRGRDFQIAKDALATDFVRQMGQEGAIADPSGAAQVIRDITANRFQSSREVRRALYDTAGQLPGATNDLDSTNLVTFFQNHANRLDVGSITSQADRRFAFTNGDLMSHLQRQAPVTAQTAPGTVITTIPDQQQLAQQGFLGPYTFQGVNPQGMAMIQTQTSTGTPVTLPMSMQGMSVLTSATNYRNLAELSSTLGYVQRDALARAKNAADPSALLVNARTAGFLQQRVQQELTRMEVGGQIPRRTLQAFRYANKLAAEEAETFTNPLIVKIASTFADQPELFARELLKPDNADTLVAIHKAVSRSPDVLFPNLGTTEAEMTSELGRRTLYKTQNPNVWDTKIRPQLQAGLVRDSLETQSGAAFEQALDYGKTGAYANQQMARRMGQTGAQQTVNPDDFVRLNPQKLLTNLEAMTPNTREAVFGNSQAYNRALTMAQAMQNYDVKHSAGIGSFLVLSKQSGAITQMTAALTAAATTEYGTENHLATLGIFAGILLSPMVIARIANNPQTYKQFMTAVKQTPANFRKTKIVARITQDVAREALQENERHYPVLSGESP